MSTTAETISAAFDHEPDRQFLSEYYDSMTRNAEIGRILRYWKHLSIAKDRAVRSQGYHEGMRRAALMKGLRLVPYAEPAEWVDWRNFDPATGDFLVPRPPG